MSLSIQFFLALNMDVLLEWCQSGPEELSVIIIVSLQLHLGVYFYFYSYFVCFVCLFGYIMLCPFFVCSKCQCLSLKKKQLTTLNHLPLCFLDKIWWQDRHRAPFAWVLTLMLVQPLDLQGTLHASLIHSFIYLSSFSVKVISGLGLSEILKILQKLPDI